MDPEPLPCAVCGKLPDILGPQSEDVIGYDDPIYTLKLKHAASPHYCPNRDGAAICYTKAAMSHEMAHSNVVDSWNIMQVNVGLLIANRDKIQGQIKAADLKGWA